jgi:hypothetical protein
MQKIICRQDFVVFLMVCVLIGVGTNVYPGIEIVPDSLKEDMQRALSRLEKECPDHKFIEKMKHAGASYFPEIAARPEKAQVYRDAEIQRQMVGVYLFDMSYASVFGKNKDSVKYADAINTLLTKRGFNNKKVVQQYKKAVSNFNGPDAKKIFIELGKVIESSLDEVIDTPGGLHLAVDAAYGGLIEGLYLTTEIVAQKNYKPQFLRLLNEQKNSCKLVMEIMDILKSHPDFAQFAECNERIETIKTIFNKMKTPNQMNKANVEEIRVLVAKIRADIVK